MNQPPTLSEALGVALEQPDLRLPANFSHIQPCVDEVTKRVYISGACCQHYHSAQYQTIAFYKSSSRSIDYEQPFVFEEVP